MGSDYIIESAEDNDILYNEDKFQKGIINLCVVTGFSGGGKSSLSAGIKAEHIDMDKVVMYSDRDDSFFKDAGDCIKSYMNGPGKKFRISKEEKAKEGINKFWKDITQDFVQYVIKYAAAHKNKKFILDGVWVYKYINPNVFDNYAVFIKGTSAFTSAKRAAKRGSNNPNAKTDKLSKLKYGVTRFAAVSEDVLKGNLKKWQNHFRPLYLAQIEKGGKTCKEYVETKIRIYESFDKGYITESEKDKYLSMLN